MPARGGGRRAFHPACRTKWGGFDTPRQFAERLKADAANGGAPPRPGTMGTPEKQAAGDAAASRFAAGVDCSGFVSRCWRLSRPFSTRELPAPFHFPPLLG